MKNATLRGKPDAGNPHVAPTLRYGDTGRFDEGEVAPVKPRRGSLLYNIKLISAVLSVVSFSLACAAEVTVKSTSLSVSIDEKSGTISRIRTTAGMELSTSRCDYSPIWMLDICRENSFTNWQSVMADKVPFKGITPIENGYLLSWGETNCLKSVQVKVWAAPGDRKIRWRFAAEPQPGFALYKTTFPRVRLTSAIGTTGMDDVFVSGLGHTGLLRNPCAADAKWMNRMRVGRQPGPLAMPFATFYDSMAGFYTACEDPDGEVKEFRFKADHFSGTEFDWRRFNFSTSADEQPYDIVMAGFDGSATHPIEWYDAADMYREWAEKQRWCRTKMLDRKDLPAWTREAPAMVCFFSQWVNRPDLIRRFYADYWMKKFPGIHTIAPFIGWEQYGEWMAHDYFPMHPSDEVTSSVMRDIKRYGAHPWPWPSGHYWTLAYNLNKKTGDFKYDWRDDFYKRGYDKLSCRNQAGGVNTIKAAHLCGGEETALCVGRADVRELWTTNLIMQLVRRGADMVQADQDTGAHTLECWATDHGHKPGEGRWKTTDMHEQYRSAIEMARKENPGFILSIEEPNDNFNDLVWIADHRNCRFQQECSATNNWEWADVFGYVYHDYVAIFQSDISSGNRFWWTHAAVEGHTPYARMRSFAEIFPEEDGKKVCDCKEYYDFFENWVKLFHGRGRPWLAHGRHLRPPILECRRVRYDYRWRNSCATTEMPAVFHAFYEAPNGKRALILGNATMQMQNCGWHFPGGEVRYRVWLNPGEIRIIEL